MRYNVRFITDVLTSAIKDLAVQYFFFCCSFMEVVRTALDPSLSYGLQWHTTYSILLCLLP